ncbi:hypothetical protein GCM10010233_44180 [Streptomyces pseudogriseolus]|nr:hypothetical protein GCM10010233_44180 [Streptomyces gancidicus]
MAGAAGARPVAAGLPRGAPDGVRGERDEGDDDWCLAGMTAPVRVNEGGRMTVGRWVLRCLSGVYPQEPSHTVRVGNPALC